MKEINWQLWYADTFDRETPRRVERSGRGLPAGLRELWSHHLRESVLPEGGDGFARFNLWLIESKQAIHVEGSSAGMLRLRKWLLARDDGERAQMDDELLDGLVAVHARLWQRGQTSQTIVAAAETASDLKDFMELLLHL